MMMVEFKVYAHDEGWIKSMCTWWRLNKKYVHMMKVELKVCAHDEDWI